MSYKYTLEGLSDHVVVVEKFTGSKLKEENPQLLATMVGLWKQLDKAEEIYDKPFGLVAPDPGNLDKVFEQKIVQGSGYILKADGKCVGMALTKTSEYPGTYWIYALVVDQSYRGKGYGKTFLSEIINRNGTRRPILRVSMNNPSGLALYKSLGFVPMTQVMIRKQ